MTVAAPIVADSIWGLSKTAWGSTRATREMLSRRGDWRMDRGGSEIKFQQRSASSAFARRGTALLLFQNSICYN